MNTFTFKIRLKIHGKENVDEIFSSKKEIKLDCLYDWFNVNNTILSLIDKLLSNRVWFDVSFKDGFIVVEVKSEMIFTKNITTCEYSEGRYILVTQPLLDWIKNEINEILTYTFNIVGTYDNKKVRLSEILTNEELSSNKKRFVIAKPIKSEVPEYMLPKDFLSKWEKRFDKKNYFFELREMFKEHIMNELLVFNNF